MPFNFNANVSAEHDSRGAVHSLEHIQQPFVSGQAGIHFANPQATASQYLLDVASIYDIPVASLQDLNAPIRQEPTQEAVSLRFLEEKTAAKTTVVTYQQTVLGLPIWEAGFTASLLERNRVVSSYSSLRSNIQVDKPSHDVKFIRPVDPGKFAEIHGHTTAESGPTSIINSTRLLIYRYDPDKRFEESEAALVPGPSPTLPLPRVPENIIPGRHYVVRENLFTLSVPGFRDLNWRSFVDVNTGVVLYLRALVASANCYVYLHDPFTLLGSTGPPPTDTTARLDAPRSLQPLLGLMPSTPETLTGEFVQFKDTDPPVLSAPTSTTGDFLFTSTTNDFSAVNAYFHLDQLFRMVRDMGYNISTLFHGTSINPGFPVPFDFAGEGTTPGLGNDINAHAIANTGGDGIGHFTFGVAADRSDPPAIVGIADDPRIVDHEFCHALLDDNIHSSTFAFAHSAGDSLAAILNDPGSRALDRFQSFPWVISLQVNQDPGQDRRHDRDVAAGWAWGGVHDLGSAGYQAEQILSTTLFRAYRSIGGDALGHFDTQTWASRYLVYLIVGGIAGLAAQSATVPSVTAYVNALMKADSDIVTFGGQPGGAIRKIIRWAFEKQGLYQHLGATGPVTGAGDPPGVDVYINDGRNGEYQYHPMFWENTDIWNRLMPGLADTTHQNPIIMQTNYAYVRVKNRGTKTATNIVVSGYHCRPSAGLTWPDDWKPMDTPSLSLRDLLSGDSDIAGPFLWTPSELGHECMLFGVTALGDLSNLDPASGLPCTKGPTPHFRLVPFDNNIGQRNVVPVAGGTGSGGLTDAMRGRHFWIHNPYDRAVRANVDIQLPPFLAQRNWGFKVDGAGDGIFNLGPRASREVTIQVHPGSDFTPGDVESDFSKTIIRFALKIEGLIVGGMSYAVDPIIKVQPPEVGKPTDGTVCNDAARDLLSCFGIQAGRVRKVRAKRITVDIDLDDCDC